MHGTCSSAIGPKPHSKASWAPLRMVTVAGAVLLAFMGVAGQLVRLALDGQSMASISMAEPIGASFARPDIVDRNGRLIATDVSAPSLFADPSLIQDRDEVVEKLGRIFPDLETAGLRRDLADRNRRFVWVRRGVAPAVAQRVHDLGLPGLAFRNELKRTYPAGSLAGHVLGSVNVDNRGASGLEQYIDETLGVEAVHGASLSNSAPVHLSIDMGAQHALEAELADAERRYQAAAAASIVMDVRSGEIVASASRPAVDPARPALGAQTLDKISGATFELGSIFKTFTVAMAIDQGLVTPTTIVDVRKPLTFGKYTIKDLHPQGRALSVAEIFLTSSNVGAGMLAQRAGPSKHKDFLNRLGVLDNARSEKGPVAAALAPEAWGALETVTISYGHGLAVAPIRVAAAAATLVNGGTSVTPTFLRQDANTTPNGTQLVKPETSAIIRDLMRRNVTEKIGTANLAEAPGYRLGGKTGTAEMPGKGGYREKAVISSFLGMFPAEAPRYVVLFMLFEPKATDETKGEITAGLNAAPATGRLVSRLAPLLGVKPTDDAAQATAAFDGLANRKY